MVLCVQCQVVIWEFFFNPAAWTMEMELADGGKRPPCILSNTFSHLTTDLLYLLTSYNINLIYHLNFTLFQMTHYKKLLEVYWESRLKALNDSLILFDLTHLLVNRQRVKCKSCTSMKIYKKTQVYIPIALWSTAEGAARPLGLLPSWGELVCPGTFRGTVTHGGAWGWKGPRPNLKAQRIFDLISMSVSY